MLVKCVSEFVWSVGSSSSSEFLVDAVAVHDGVTTHFPDVHEELADGGLDEEHDHQSWSSTLHVFGFWTVFLQNQVAEVGADESDENDNHVHNDFSQTVESTEAQEVVGDDLHRVAGRCAIVLRGQTHLDVGVLVEELQELLEHSAQTTEALHSQLAALVLVVLLLEGVLS